MLPLRDLRVTPERSCAALGDALEEGDELRDDVVHHGHARERIHAAEPGNRDLREFSSDSCIYRIVELCPTIIIGKCNFGATFCESGSAA